jgi:cyclopropane fatty-acyl-phospholipid synthase-like methyltransferase
MTSQYTLDEIRAFWTKQAQEHGQSPAASWSDISAIQLEIREILKWLNDGEHILDVGCANGYSTIQFASQKNIHIRGLDYIPQMVDEAKARLAELGDKLQGQTEFDVGDINALNEPSNNYDKVIVIRVIINLGNWENQLRAFKECARVVKPGGLLLLSEATLQGWEKLNAFRREWGLTNIPMPPFNNYLDQDQVVQSAAPELELVEIVNFSSTYFVGTRILKPLLARAADVGINIADPNMEWNRWFSQLPAAGDYGTQKLFVFRKVSAS